MEVDWWALGVLMHEMVFGLGVLPFDAEEGDNVALFKLIIGSEPEVAKTHARTPERPKHSNTRTQNRAQGRARLKP